MYVSASYPHMAVFDYSRCGYSCWLSSASASYKVYMPWTPPMAKRTTLRRCVVLFIIWERVLTVCDQPRSCMG